ncbi:TonB-dependent receptor [Sphingopyxis sp. L1A2A]|uniref:TonB-dependent receptor n=1 Tax=Sphingopyxis sp. L1A2A TaxID=2502247 RepID=UPI0010F47EBE|nr:TonB-dependent receptor [Sphingopyxis sp. L1A2A]
MPARAAAFAVALAATPAGAQEAAPAHTAADMGDAIVVTAQKRAENIQDVPISIAAVSGETMESANVLTVMGLGRVATNFQTVRSSNTGSTRIGIRGVGSLANTLIEPSVAVFVDGVYVPRSGSILGAFLDIDGVEVLRGPQGTLFGRKASVGALSIRSALPDDEFSGEVSAEAGSFDRYKLAGHINVALGDNVSARLAAMGQWYDGPRKNRFDGKTYGGSDDVAVRGTVGAEFGNLEWIVRGDYVRLDGDGVVNFDRETVKNYEIGAKTSRLDRALTANITFFRMDIAGFQDRAFDGVSFVVRNAGNLRQQGFELDLKLAPSDRFSLSSSLAYLDSKFTDFAGASGLPGIGGTQDLTGKPNSFSPAWSGNVGVDWNGDIGSSGCTWAANANVSFVSDQYVGTVNDANPQSLADGYALLGARLTLNGPNDRWSLALFGSNLTNTDYRPLAVYQPLGGALGLNNGAFPGSTANRILANEPRTYGVSARVRF